MAHVRALVRRRAPDRRVVLSIGDLSLDPERREVHRRGVEIRLTSKEFALLTYLMRHPGVVVSKDQILDNVWDAAFEGNANIVEVYIGYLRRKIDAAFSVASIETVRGMGYRIVGPPQPLGVAGGLA